MRSSLAPFAPSFEQREVESQPRRPERARVGVELRLVALSLLVEESLDAGAFVPARLEIDDPLLAVRVAQHAIHHERAQAFVRAQPQAMFGARFRMRAEHPTPPIVGKGVL